jgi:hypothetical protein
MKIREEEEFEWHWKKNDFELTIDEFEFDWNTSSMMDREE